MLSSTPRWAFACPTSLRFATHSSRKARAPPSRPKGIHYARASMGRSYFECLSPDLRKSSSQDTVCSAPRTLSPRVSEVCNESAEVRRVWEPTQAGMNHASDMSSVATVMSYNVLAQSYVSSKIFDATHRPFLRARHRRRRLWEELRCLTTLHEVDVLCLQELEADEHRRIATELPEFDEGCYKQRTAVGVRRKRDGCGVYWRKSTFSRVVRAVADDAETVDEHVELNSISDDPLLSLVCDSKNETLRNCRARTPVPSRRSSPQARPLTFRSCLPPYASRRWCIGALAAPIWR